MSVFVGEFPGELDAAFCFLDFEDVDGAVGSGSVVFVEFLVIVGVDLSGSGLSVPFGVTICCEIDIDEAAPSGVVVEVAFVVEVVPEAAHVSGGPLGDVVGILAVAGGAEYSESGGWSGGFERLAESHADEGEFPFFEWRDFGLFERGEEMDNVERRLWVDLGNECCAYAQPVDLRVLGS